MTKYLVLGFLLTAITGVSVRGAEPWAPESAANLVKAGLALDGSDPAPADPAPPAATQDQSQSACAGVSFTRNLKYGESDQNVLDVATRDSTGDSRETSPHPVLVFVAGESFATGASDAAGPLRDEVLCFSVHHGMVSGRGNYRLAPPHPLPPRAHGVAAWTSRGHHKTTRFAGHPAADRGPG